MNILSLNKWSVTKAMAVMALLASLHGCASHPPNLTHIAPLQGQPVITVSDIDQHRVTLEMQEFMERYVTSGKGKESRAWSLAWASLDRNLLGFRYDPGLTLSGEQAFSQRMGNCLSFSSMFIAMARHLGLEAWYQEVEIPPQWTSTNNTLLFSLHVNAVVQYRGSQWVVDASGEGNNGARRSRRISDVEALAQYYNNLGADALTRDDLARAYAYFVKAIQTQSTLSYLWSNLGVAFNRNGQVEDARRSYLTALQMDPGQGIAANNLYLIYENEGNLEAAQQLQSQVERHRRKNPYYLYHLSSLAMEEGRYQESMVMLQRAIRLDEKEFTFHYELARTLQLLGDLDGARQSLKRALELAPQDSRVRTASLDNLPLLQE